LSPGSIPPSCKDTAAKSRAAVAAAQANVAQMEATVAEVARQPQPPAPRGRTLGRQGTVEDRTGKQRKPAMQRAVANVDSAKAAVVQAKATLKSDETNIAKAVIRAPINGVVLTRKVEPGQTVVANR
jgi:HlyD family secretion protein